MRLTLGSDRLACYAEKKGGYWQAFCLNFDLAAQGDSLADVRQRIEAQIDDYVREALVEDREHAEYLLSRRAPLRMWLKYYAGGQRLRGLGGYVSPRGRARAAIQRSTRLRQAGRGSYNPIASPISFHA